MRPKEATVALTDYVGMDIFSSDGEKLGEVKESRGDYLVVDRSLARDIALPLRDVDLVGDHLVVPYTEDFIDDAPDVDLDNGVLADEDRRSLDDYYLRRAA